MRRSRYAMRWQQVGIPWYKERSSETQGIDARKRPVVEMEYKDIVVGNRRSRASLVVRYDLGEIQWPSLGGHAA